MKKTTSKWLYFGAAGAAAAGVLIPLVPVLRRRAMRVTTILRKDHRLVSAMLTTMEFTPKVNRTLINRLVEELYDSVTMHEIVEDEILYPIVRNVATSEWKASLEKASRGQQIVKEKLQKLRKTDPMSGDFDKLLADFKHTILNHAELEEHSIFPIIEERTSTERQTTMGERLHQRKKEIQQRLAA